MDNELKQEMTERFNTVYGEEVKIGLREALRKVYIDGGEHGYQYALQHPAWIPVEERLPEVGEPVWFFTPIMDEPLKGAYQGNDTWWSVEYESKFIDCVTHWMPMSVPQRKEE